VVAENISVLANMDELGSAEKVKVKRQILHLLKMKGEQTAVNLAEALDVSPMAIRQHLQNLQAEQLVVYTEQRQPVGRPLKFWYLSDRAREIFPDRHDELTQNLLESIVRIFGEAGLETLIAERTQQQIDTYTTQISRQSSWQAKVATLAEIRTNEGYMAEATEESSDVWLLSENHCSIDAAARSCPSFCQSEWEVFQALLGDRVRVERIEHLLNGDRRCTYRISKN
jgi:iron-sulfur cluster biosynthesis transcriptional regulator SufR